jgi:hypothetical protein
VPNRAQDLDQLIRWQAKKAAPFPIEEAQVSYGRGIQALDGQEFVVSLARRSVVEEYEGSAPIWVRMPASWTCRRSASSTRFWPLMPRKERGMRMRTGSS